MKKYAVIVAGGSGQRMGTDLPKQFLLLKGKPILQYTLQAFLMAFDDMQVILVLPPEHIDKGVEIVRQMHAESRVQTVTGGTTRFHSVKNGLKHVKDPSIVFVQDGVRCLVSQNLIQRCFQQAMEKGSAVPAVAATDSIRIAEGNSHYSISRNSVHIVQTPQVFKSAIIQRAFEQEYTEAFTDEATVVEAAGTKVYLIEGEYNNIKVTRPLDLFIAGKLLEEDLSP